MTSTGHDPATRDASLLLKAIQSVYRRTSLTRGTGRAFDAIPPVLLGGPVVWSSTDLGRLCLSTRDHGARDLLLSGHLSHEVEETAILRRLLPQCRGFIDIGASYGWYTALAALMGEDVAILAVEAHAEVAACLTRSFRGSRGVSVSNVAVSDREGATQLFKGPGQSNLSSAVRPVGPAVSVVSTTLDAAWSSRSPLDLVKCDVEGAELLVLRGARELRRTLSPLWMIEIDEKFIRDAGHRPDEVAREVEGLACFWRDADHWAEAACLGDILGRPRRVKNVFLAPERWIGSARRVIMDSR